MHVFSIALFFYSGNMLSRETNKGDKMKSFWVEYHSEVWMKLSRNWITWEVVEIRGVRMALMVYSDKQ